MRALWVSLTLSCLALPWSSHAATLRCGNHLAAEGSSQAEVLARCGAPTHQRTVAIPVRQEEVFEQKRHLRRTVFRYIEEWTYDFGPNRFLQVVEFENGLLVDVKSGGYGS